MKDYCRQNFLEGQLTICDKPLRMLIFYGLLILALVVSISWMVCDGLQRNDKLKIEQKHKELEL